MQFMVICTFCLPNVIAGVDDIIVKVSHFINRGFFAVEFENTDTSHATLYLNSNCSIISLITWLIIM